MSTNEAILTNPISSRIAECLAQADSQICIAVPFISRFAKAIIREKDVVKVSDKRLVTRFDETNINSFEIPTLRYLLKECGFEIRFNNKIHLKQYIIDSASFITSSNLTQGGFENNIELTVEIDSDNVENSRTIFDDLWEQSASNIITESLLDENLEKYEVLKKRRATEKGNGVNVGEAKCSLDMEKLIDEVFQSRVDHSEKMQLIYQASKNRTAFKKKLLDDGFEPEMFYASEGHPKRRENLFYDFVYGVECKLAGTGLREAQFYEAFSNSNFRKALNYMYPEMIQLPAWNLDDEISWSSFCKGLFEFDIPQYKEALPIRFASYFYPDKFLPIFKLDHLETVCDALGIVTDAKSRGERLFAYSSFLQDKLKDIPVNNYIKSNMAYHLLHAIELHEHLRAGMDYNDVLGRYKQQWRKDYIEKGRRTLENIGMLENI